MLNWLWGLFKVPTCEETRDMIVTVLLEEMLIEDWQAQRLADIIMKRVFGYERPYTWEES